MPRAKYIRNKQELIALLNVEMEKTLNKVVEAMEGELKNQIEKDTYQADYFPNIQYYGKTSMDDDGSGQLDAYPTFEFLDAWKKNAGVDPTSGRPSVSIEFDPNKLSAMPHRALKGGHDVRKNLADILNLAYEGYEPGYTSGLMVGRPEGTIASDDPGTMRNVSKFRRPFWTNFIKRMTTGGIIRKLIKEYSTLNLE